MTGMALWAALAGSSAWAITNGTDTDEPAAVVGIAVDGDIWCSGIVVSDTWVLTEYSCFEGVETQMGEGKTVQIAVGGDLATVRLVDVVDAVGNPAVDLTDFMDPHRVALLQLATSAGVTPLVLSSRAETDLAVGESVTLNGWGIESDNGSDTRHREGAVQIESVADGIVVTSGTSNFCNNDGGGPVLDSAGEVIGVGAWVAPGCIGGTAGSWIPGRSLEWIEATTGGLGGTGTGTGTGSGTGTGTGSDPSDTGPDTSDDGGGCGCASTGAAPAGAAGWIALLALVRRRY